MIEHIPRTYSYVRVIEPRRLVSIRVSAFLSALTDTPSAKNKRKSSIDSERYSQIPRSYVRMIVHISRT